MYAHALVAVVDQCGVRDHLDCQRAAPRCSRRAESVDEDVALCRSGYALAAAGRSVHIPCRFGG
jgi:hypothetical protein